jgi:hypothetical protein
MIIESNLNISLIFIGVSIFSIFLACRTFKLFPLQRKRRSRLQDTSFSSGDLLLYHTNAQVQFILNSDFSHVGLVYKDSHGILFVWEISPENNGRATLEPLMPSLTKLLWKGKNSVIHRKLKKKINIDLFTEFINKHMDSLQYCHDYWRAALHRWFDHFWLIVPPVRSNVSPGFDYCTGLTMKTLRYLGVIDAVNEKPIIPSDFSEKNDHIIHWKNNYAFGNEVLIIL